MKTRSCSVLSLLATYSVLLVLWEGCSAMKPSVPAVFYPLGTATTIFGRLYQLIMLLKQMPSARSGRPGFSSRSSLALAYGGNTCGRTAAP